MNAEPRELPTLPETALGGFFQDVGKFVQRAFGAARNLEQLLGPDSAAQVRTRETIVLPSFKGRYSHRHVFWSDAFFQWMEERGLSFPREQSGAQVNLAQVRRMAVHHHVPDVDGALGWLAAEADRLSSGMDREQRKDGETEADAESSGWDAFIRTPMLSPFSRVDIGLGSPPVRYQPLGELVPGDGIMPVAKVDAKAYLQRYRALWESFSGDYETLCRSAPNADAFIAGLLALSERYTFAVPSSTVDVPDISLHDHSRTVAAIAACLHEWHAKHGTLTEVAAIRDRRTPKYRLLAGDLSGIQDTLFLLANEQVKGVNRTLRARSFLMGALVDTAALMARHDLGLPSFNLLQNAGGRFVLLVPALPHAEEAAARLRNALDTWMRDRYHGSLTLNIALSSAFAGEDFMRGRFAWVQADLARAHEEAKQRPLAAAEPTGTVEVSYPNGPCRSCGRRPAEVADRYDADVIRCRACHDEHELGGRLPRAEIVSWHSSPPRAERRVALFGGYYLALDAEDSTKAIAAYRPWRDDEPLVAAWPARFLANRIPTLTEADLLDPRYDDVEEDEQPNPGDAKTFGHIERDALELNDRAELLGRPYLAILKADVDRLGFLFGYGLQGNSAGESRATIGRFAALSRLTDFFFTGELPAMLRGDSRFRSTYTVYAGGDDLLLIGPWRQTVELAIEIRTRFRRFTGDNPNLTLSASIELTRADQPLNRSVRAAEARLEAAKMAGRDRACVVAAEPLSWDSLAEVLRRANWLSGLVRGGVIGTGFLFRLRYFGEQRRRAEETPPDLSCADWRARWGYSLRRLVLNRRGDERAARDLARDFNALLGLDEDLSRRSSRASDADDALRIATDIALYRNRH